MIKLSFDQGRDHIDNFVPFVVECLRRSPGSMVELPYIQQELRSLTGLDIPQGVLKTILRRCASKGYVTRSHNCYIRNVEKIQESSFLKDRDKVVRKYQAILNRLREFVATRYSVEWDESEAEHAMLTYLEGHAPDILAAALESRPLPSYSKQSQHYLVSRFVTETYAHDPEGFDFLESIVKGLMLANVVYWFPHFGTLDQRFQKLQVFFDTPFLLRALGYAGDLIAAPCKELLGACPSNNQI